MGMCTAGSLAVPVPHTDRIHGIA